jgi:hypothetical protein
MNFALQFLHRKTSINQANTVEMVRFTPLFDLLDGLVSIAKVTLMNGALAAIHVGGDLVENRREGGLYPARGRSPPEVPKRDQSGQTIRSTFIFTILFAFPVCWWLFDYYAIRYSLTTSFTH